MDKLILELIKQSKELRMRIQDIERRVKNLENENNDLGSIGTS